MNAPTNPDELFAAIQSKLCLAALVREDKPMDAFKLARDVFAKFPALFADFAENLRAETLEPRAACWALAQDLRDVPGSWDLYTRASELASV